MKFFSTAVITREILGNVPKWLQVSFYITVFVVGVVVAVVFYQQIAKWRKGRREVSRKDSLGTRLLSWLSYLTFHEQMRRDRYAGIAHLLTCYGFVVLFIGTCLVFLEHQTPLHFFYGRFYLISSLIIDLGGAVFVVGLAMLLWRRHCGKCQRLMKNNWATSMAWLLMAISISGFLLEGARIAENLPDYERWSIVGYSFAMIMQQGGIAGESALPWHTWLWGGHAVLCIAFFALLPWHFYSHIVYSSLSWVLRKRESKSRLRTPDLEQRKPGAQKVEELSWIDLLQADACTTCGRCNEVCPAHAAGKALRPREIVLGVRESDDLNQLNDEALWACTTCSACNDACPVGIEVYDKIVEARRGRVEQGQVPEMAAEVFESTLEDANPFGKSPEDRMVWARGLQPPVAQPEEKIELLYWVGCAGSFDPEGQSVSRAMIKILDHLQINYHILGCQERCTGDPARRMGEEGLYQKCATSNIAQFQSHGVKKILTHCPHCFNTFANEYPDLGGQFTVEHHSQFLQRMIQEGRLRLPAQNNGPVTFHDPCYLGRGNGETQAPRDILKSLGSESVEMPRHGNNSFCCGAGGGSMWLDIQGEDRVENIRAEEASQTGANTVATGCPYCKVMIEAGRQNLEETQSQMRVKDLAELVLEAEGIST